jgi:hypothetical protein
MTRETASSRGLHPLPFPALRAHASVHPYLKPALIRFPPSSFLQRCRSRCCPASPLPQHTRPILLLQVRATSRLHPRSSRWQRFCKASGKQRRRRRWQQTLSASPSPIRPQKHQHRGQCGVALVQIRLPQALVTTTAQTLHTLLPLGAVQRPLVALGLLSCQSFPPCDSTGCDWTLSDVSTMTTAASAALQPFAHVGSCRSVPALAAAAQSPRSGRSSVRCFMLSLMFESHSSFRPDPSRRAVGLTMFRSALTAALLPRPFGLSFCAFQSALDYFLRALYLCTPLGFRAVLQRRSHD